MHFWTALPRLRPIIDAKCAADREVDIVRHAIVVECLDHSRPELRHFLLKFEVSASLQSAGLLQEHLEFVGRADASLERPQLNRRVSTGAGAKLELSGVVYSTDLLQQQFVGEPLAPPGLCRGQAPRSRLPDTL